MQVTLHQQTNIISPRLLSNAQIRKVRSNIGQPKYHYFEPNYPEYPTSNIPELLFLYEIELTSYSKRKLEYDNDMELCKTACACVKELMYRHKKGIIQHTKPANFDLHNSTGETMIGMVIPILIKDLAYHIGCEEFPCGKKIADFFAEYNKKHTLVRYNQIDFSNVTIDLEYFNRKYKQVKTEYDNETQTICISSNDGEYKFDLLSLFTHVEKKMAKNIIKENLIMFDDSVNKTKKTKKNNKSKLDVIDLHNEIDNLKTFLTKADQSYAEFTYNDMKYIVTDYNIIMLKSEGIEDTYPTAEHKVKLGVQHTSINTIINFVTDSLIANSKNDIELDYAKLVNLKIQANIDGKTEIETNGCKLNLKSGLGMSFIDQFFYRLKPTSHTIMYNTINKQVVIESYINYTTKCYVIVECMN